MAGIGAALFSYTNIYGGISGKQAVTSRMSLVRKDITIMRTRASVPIHIDHFTDLVQTGKVNLSDIITHPLPLSEAPYSYDIFKKKSR